MTIKEIVKLLLFCFVPTSLLGLFNLFGIDIHTSNLANIMAVVLVPVYLAYAGNLFILNNQISSKVIILLVVLLSVLATIHALHMLYDEVWQHVLRMPTHLDFPIVLNIIIGLSLGVLLISYPILNAVISKFRS